MHLIKSAFASAAMLAGGLFGMAPQDADAGVRFSVGVGNGGYGHSHYGGYRGYGFRNYGHYGGYGGYRYNRGFVGRGYGGPVWHDTGHYDYHPTTVVPHGNHYDVVPGHYHYHNTGHWH